MDNTIDSNIPSMGDIGKVNSVDSVQSSAQETALNPVMAKTSSKVERSAIFASLPKNVQSVITAAIQFPKTYETQKMMVQETVDYFVHIIKTHAFKSKAEISSDPQITNENDVPAFEAGVDKVESDWRANEKYTLISSQITTGLKALLGEGPQEVKTLSERLSKGPTKEMTPFSSPRTMSLPGIGEKLISGSPEGKCEFYTAKALYALENPDKFRNQREAYREYKANLRTALESEHYKSNPDSNIAKLLNKIAFCEFTKVNMQGFTQSVAQKSAEKGEFVPTGYSPIIGETPKEQALGYFNNMLGDIDEYHHSIRDYSKTPEGIVSTIQGEIFCAGLDSTVQGNPANVKCRMEDSNGKEITNVRTPSPTGKNGEVTPEFKAFLREIKAQGKKYTMINLQNRTEPSAFQKATNRIGEHVRSTNLEDLQTDPEFADVFTCFTLDKNSDFFAQKAEGSMNAESFINDFMDKLTTDPNSGFFIPPKFLEGGRKDAIQEKLNMVHQTIFKGAENLTQKERQDFIEAAYIFLADYYIKETGADYYNESCKDCIDRGGGANWTMMSTLNLLEIFDPDRKHDMSSDLPVRITNLLADLEGDAIWARKRPIIHERVERAQHVMVRMVETAVKNPETAKIWAEELNFKKLIFNADTSQATKDPSFKRTTLPDVSAAMLRI